MDVDRMVNKAREESARRNFDYAIQLYQEILGLRPDLVEARRGLREAELRKFSQRYPSRLETALKGLVPRVSIAFLRAAKRNDALLAACERYLRHDPRSLSVNRVLAEAASRAGYVDTAILVFEGIAEMHPEDFDSLKRLGDLFHRKGEIDRSLEAYEKALALRPHDPEVEKARKNLAAEGAIRSTGIDRATSSRELVKDKERLRRIEADKKLVRSPEELAEAIAEQEARLEERPDDVRTLRGLAELYHQKGDAKEAIEVLEEALEIDPDSEDLRTRLGDWKMRALSRQLAAARESGDAAKIREAEAAERDFRTGEYRRRVESHPTDSRSRYLLGSALLDVGEVDAAIGEFQQTVRDPKHRLDSLVKLAVCFQRKKMYDLASRQLGEALEAASRTGEREIEIQYMLGSVYEAMGDRPRALDAYSRVYEKNIQYREVAAKMKSLSSEKERPQNEDQERSR